MMKLLVVITTHNKYVENGYVDRCLDSWKKNFKSPLFKIKYTVINDSDRLHLGVTQSRIEGYIQAREGGFDWVTFCDADAYVAEKIRIPSSDDLADPNTVMFSCHYGYRSEKGANTVDTLAEGNYNLGTLGDFIFSTKCERDYPVFMGRFFRVSSLSADMFVDTKMYGDDGTFFMLYCGINHEKRMVKLRGKVESAVESDKSLPLINVQTGEQMMKWTMSKVKYLIPSHILDKYVFQKFIFAYLQYTYFLYGYISEEDWNHAIQFMWDYRVELRNLDISQLAFMDSVKSGVDATEYMKKRYSEL